MLFGLETELAFSAWKEHETGSRTFRDRMIPQLFELARTRICSLSDLDSAGIFLANGSRFYLDSGEHPEFCTPECRSPAELVRWQLAGEKLLADLGVELEKNHAGSRVSLFRCNVDYSGTHAVWGCHESYLYKNNKSKLPNHLIPHLVSRLVYTGAGGFDNLKPELEFVISPRVPHLTHRVGPGDSPGRGIYHAKNEPLCGGGFGRLHLMCGESLSSQLSNYLKVGATALVVRLIDAGVSSADKLAFESPQDAMRTFSSDLSCRTAQPLQDGRRRTAIEVQMEYLEMVERHIGAVFMPEWAADVCRRWRAVLDDLRLDPDSLSTRLDWAIKHALVRERTSRRRTGTEGLEINSPEAAELCEIDTRFGELGERGIFHSLDRAGALEHHIPELGSVEEAISAAPPGGRAGARGKAISQLHTNPIRYKASWDGIFDFDTGRTLRMSDPFDSNPGWQGDEADVRGRSATSQAEIPNFRPEPFVDRGVHHYVRMNIPRAIVEFERAIRIASSAGDFGSEALARFWCATAHTETGNVSALQEILAPALAQATRIQSPSTRIRLWTRYAISLIERPARLLQIETTLERARQSLDSSSSAGVSRISMIEGRLLAARGRYAEAIEVTERSIEEGRRDSIAFASSSHWYRIITYCLRNRDVEAAKRHLAGWKRESSQGDRDLYVAGLLACAESDIARADGRPREALDFARSMLEHTRRSKNPRWRLSIRRAAVSSAIAVGELEWARPVLDQMLRGCDIPIAHVACEAHRLDAIYHLALAQRSQSVADPLAILEAFEDEGESHTHRYTAELRRFGEAYRRARAYARTLDDRLRTDCHARELATSIGEIVGPSGQAEGP